MQEGRSPYRTLTKLRPPGPLYRALVAATNWALQKLAHGLELLEFIDEPWLPFSAWRWEPKPRTESHLPVERVAALFRDPEISGISFRASALAPALAARLPKVESLAWSPGIAVAVLESLEELDVHKLEPLTRLARELTQLLTAGSGYRSTHIPSVLTALGHEGRINAITKPETPPRDLLSAGKRQSLRNQLSEIEAAARALRSMSERLCAHEERSSQWWSIAEVACRAAAIADEGRSTKHSDAFPVRGELENFHSEVSRADALIRSLATGLLSERVKEVWKDALSATQTGPLAFRVVLSSRA